MEKALSFLVRFGKFVALIVVPATVWLMALRQDVARASMEIVTLQARQDRADQERGALREKLDDQYSTIVRELGEIQGELKRISR